MLRPLKLYLFFYEHLKKLTKKKKKSLLSISDIVKEISYFRLKKSNFSKYKFHELMREMENFGFVKKIDRFHYLIAEDILFKRLKNFL